MAKFAPQYSLFSIIDRLKTGIVFLFWLIFLLSIANLIIKPLNISFDADDLINTINIMSICFFFILEIIVEYILIPQADSKRRDDFIDNAFGSKFSPNSSIGYYDTDEIQKGIYKAACNLFENCFFTYSLTRIITIKKIILPGLVFLLVLICAYYGFKQVPFALTLLQTLFSGALLGDLVKHIILITRLHSIQDSWINLFQHSDLKSNSSKYHSNVYRYWLQYETLHSRFPAGVSEKVFNRNNQRLTDEWNKLKHRYNIN